MVQNAYTVTLVAALVPLAAGIFWKESEQYGAILSAVSASVAWLIAAFTAADATVPPTGRLAFSILGMVLGAIVPRAGPQAHHHDAPAKSAPPDSLQFARPRFLHPDPEVSPCSHV